MSVEDGDASDTGKRTVIAALGMILGVIVLSRVVVVGLLLLLDVGVALLAGGVLAAVWELWHGTYRIRQTQPPGEELHGRGRR